MRIFLQIIRNKLLCLLLHFISMCWTFDGSCITNERERSAHFRLHLPLLDSVSGSLWLTSPTLSLSHFVNTALLAFHSLCSTLSSTHLYLSRASLTVLQLFVPTSYSLCSFPLSRQVSPSTPSSTEVPFSQFRKSFISLVVIRLAGGCQARVGDYFYFILFNHIIR